MFSRTDMSVSRRSDYGETREEKGGRGTREISDDGGVITG